MADNLAKVARIKAEADRGWMVARAHEIAMKEMAEIIEDILVAMNSENTEKDDKRGKIAKR